MNDDDDYCYYNAADEGNVVDGDDRHFFRYDLGNTFYIYSEEGRIYSSGPPSICHLWYPTTVVPQC